MVVASILPHAESGPNDHRKDAPPFIGFGGEVYDHDWKYTILADFQLHKILCENTIIGEKYMIFWDFDFSKRKTETIRSFGRKINDHSRVKYTIVYFTCDPTIEVRSKLSGVQLVPYCTVRTGSTTMWSIMDRLCVIKWPNPKSKKWVILALIRFWVMLHQQKRRRFHYSRRPMWFRR